MFKAFHSQLVRVVASTFQVLLDGMRQDALRRAHLGDLDPAKLSLARSPTNRHEP